jgi:hypothetical protein
MNEADENKLAEVDHRTIEKSSRHQKIIGDFGENLICNWLSRSGFEVTIVDHTGIDLVAYNPKTKKRLGITVKSRTRMSGKEKEAVYVFHGKDEVGKTLDGCQAFGCEPWIGIYVETTEYADLYLTSFNNYQAKYMNKMGKRFDDWKMTEKYSERYEQDHEVKHIRMKFDTKDWNWKILDLQTVSGGEE